jgi:tetratricopeptide (TPR) repeat protein
MYYISLIKLSFIKLKNKRHLNFLIFIYIILGTAYAQDLANIDSLKQSSLSINKKNTAYVNLCFKIADANMDIEQYDSAQIWLNKIYTNLPAKSNSVNNYFLITRQAEIYYYSNLLQLGLQESKRGLEMATALKDSALLADSYNFLGLFCLSMDSLPQAIKYFKLGLPYFPKVAYLNVSQNLTKPHHLYGNIAEASFKLKQYNDALRYYKLSLTYATIINVKRGISIANTGIADVFNEYGLPDSAIAYYKKAIENAFLSKDLDVALNAYANKSKCYFKNGKIALANQSIDTV